MPDETAAQAADSAVPDAIPAAANSRATIQAGKRPVELLKKLLAVLSEVETLAKEGQNTAPGQGYKFISIEQMKRMLVPLLAKHGVVPLPTVLTSVDSWTQQGKSGNTNVITRAWFEWEWCDAETGDTIRFPIVGDALDNQDKGILKCQTAAIKAALKSGFLIAEDGEDADATNEEEIAQSACPECGKTGAVIKSKFPKRPGELYCLPSGGGCGASFVPAESKRPAPPPPPTPITPRPAQQPPAPPPQHGTPVQRRAEGDIAVANMDLAEIDPHVLEEIYGNLAKVGKNAAQAEHFIRSYTGTLQQLIGLTGGWAFDAEQQKAKPPQSGPRRR